MHQKNLLHLNSIVWLSGNIWIYRNLKLTLFYPYITTGNECQRCNIYLPYIYIYLYKVSILYAFFSENLSIYSHAHGREFIFKIDGSRNVIAYFEEHRVFCKCMNILTVADDGHAQILELLIDFCLENCFRVAGGKHA